MDHPPFTANLAPSLDPFDRLLVAQAISENIPVVSVGVAFDPYGVTRLW